MLGDKNNGDTLFYKEVTKNCIFAFWEIAKKNYIFGCNQDFTMFGSFPPVLAKNHNAFNGS